MVAKAGVFCGFWVETCYGSGILCHVVTCTSAGWHTVGSSQTQQKKKTLLQRNIILVLLIKMVNYNYKKWFPSSDLTGKKPLLRYIINKNYARTISKDLTK
jgi:hypothetical protein